MRTLRIVTILLFAVSLLFGGWAHQHYYGNLNLDRPVIYSEQETLVLSVEEGQEALCRGLTATDATDGDLTDAIMVASTSHFLEPGTISVKYVVFDSHNNSATLTRRVHFTDYVAPVFSLDKAPVYTVGSSFDLLDHVHVEDCIEGDISDRIRITSNRVNNYTAGMYPVILEASNSFGDTASITVWVSFQSRENTALITLQQYVVYLEQGEELDPYHWLAGVTDRNAQPLDMEQIELLGNVDVNTPGFYTLTYSYDDGKLAGRSALTIVVTERQD